MAMAFAQLHNSISPACVECTVGGTMEGRRASYTPSSRSGLAVVQGVRLLHGLICNFFGLTALERYTSDGNRGQPARWALLPCSRSYYFPETIKHTHVYVCVSIYTNTHTSL